MKTLAVLVVLWLLLPYHCCRSANNCATVAVPLTCTCQAKSLFGIENRWGKLPYTIYNANYTDQV